MKEYKIVAFRYDEDEELESKINVFAKDNWRVTQVISDVRDRVGVRYTVKVLFERPKL